ncbi:MAG: DUF1844 domain-containing protein [Armatimonadetes bacterium]|nr:DUF1844 domain-containing protein [Armatimonadota bacterium]
MPEDREHEEKASYRKVDRRVEHEDEPEAAAPAEEPEAAAPAEEPEAAAPAQEPEAAAPAEEREPSSGEPSDQSPKAQPASFAEVGVFGILRFSVSMLAEAAWMSMGLIATPAGETRQDLAQARVAIDALGDLIARLQPDLDASEKRELDQLLANLRVNFVQRSG